MDEFCRDDHPELHEPAVSGFFVPFLVTNDDGTRALGVRAGFDKNHATNYGLAPDDAAKAARLLITAIILCGGPYMRALQAELHVMQVTDRAFLKGEMN